MRAPGDLQCDVPVLYPTLSGRDEPDQILGAKILFNVPNCGRDLLRMQHADLKAGPPLIMADPLFGEADHASSDRIYFPPLGVTAADQS